MRCSPRWPRYIPAPGPCATRHGGGRPEGAGSLPPLWGRPGPRGAGGIPPPEGGAQRGTGGAARMRRFLSILFGDDAAMGGRSGGYADEQVAAAALMVEAARLDGSFTDVERDRIRKLLVQHFQLDP